MVEARAPRSAFARRAAGMADAPLGPTMRARCWWPLDLHPLLYPSSSRSSNTLTARTQVDHFCAGGPQDIPIRAECPPLTPFTNTTQGDGPGACVGCEAGTSFYNGTCVVECAVGYYANFTTATSCEACEVSIFGLHRPCAHVFNACPTLALPPIHAIPSVSFPFHRSTQHFFRAIAPRNTHPFAYFHLCLTSHFLLLLDRLLLSRWRADPGGQPHPVCSWAHHRATRDGRPVRLCPRLPTRLLQRQRDRALHCVRVWVLV